MNQESTISTMVAALENARDRLLSGMVKGGVSFIGTVEEKARSLAVLKKQVDKIMGTLTPEMSKNLTEFAQHVVKETKAQIDTMLEEKVPIKEMNLDMSQWSNAEKYAQNIDTKVTKMSSDLKAQLTSTVNLAFLGARTPEQVAAMVSKRFSVSKSKAEVIVRTENKTLQNRASEDRYSAMQTHAAVLGVTTKKRWIHSSGQTEDGFASKGQFRMNYEPRHNHKAMHGVMSDKQGFFTVTTEKGTSYKCKHPHDDVLPAEEVVNCYCDFALEIVFPEKKEAEPVKPALDPDQENELIMQQLSIMGLKIEPPVKPDSWTQEKWNATSEIEKLISHNIKVGDKKGAWSSFVFGTDENVHGVKDYEQYGDGERILIVAKINAGVLKPSDITPTKVGMSSFHPDFNTWYEKKNKHASKPVVPEGKYPAFESIEDMDTFFGLKHVPDLVKPAYVTEDEWAKMETEAKKILNLQGPEIHSLVEKLKVVPDGIDPDVWEKNMVAHAKLKYFKDVTKKLQSGEIKPNPDGTMPAVDLNMNAPAANKVEVDFPAFTEIQDFKAWLGMPKASSLVKPKHVGQNAWDNMSPFEKSLNCMHSDTANEFMKKIHKVPYAMDPVFWKNKSVEEKYDYLLSVVAKLKNGELAPNNDGSMPHLMGIHPMNVNAQPVSPVTGKVYKAVPPKPDDMGWSVWSAMSADEKIEHVEFLEKAAKDLSDKKEQAGKYLTEKKKYEDALKLMSKAKPSSIKKAQWDALTFDEKVAELKGNPHKYSNIKIHVDQATESYNTLKELRDVYGVTEYDVERFYGLENKKNTKIKKEIAKKASEIDVSNWFDKKTVEEMSQQKVRGKTYLVDAQDIEDNAMHVYRVQDKDGNPVNRIRFKLTKEASDAAAATLRSSKKSMDVSVENWEIPLMTRKEDGTAVSLPGRANWTINRTLKAVTKDGVTIRLVPSERSKGMAFRGTVEVETTGDLDEAKVASMVKSVVEGLGVKTNPATNEDLYLSYVARQYKLGIGKASRPDMDKFYQTLSDDRLTAEQKTNIIKGMMPSQVAGRIPPPDKVKDLVTETGYTKRSDITRDEIEKELADYTLIHSSRAPVVELIDSFLRGQGQVTSTTERIRTGIDVTKGGMSPKEDINTGGASYFFTRIYRKDFDHGAKLEFNIGALERMDAYTARNDRYGEMRTGDESKYGDPDIARISDIDGYKMVATSTFNETMFKNGMDINELSKVWCYSTRERDAVLDLFKSYGVSKLGGRDVKEIVMVR